jgi:uncharacterized protein (TIGR03067 family)
MSRLVLALASLICLTAFAPAPFPRPERRGGGTDIDMKSFQGTWKVISMEIVQGNGQNQRLTDWGWQTTGTTGVRVKGDRWTYLNNGRDSSSYRVDIDPTKKPAAIDWFTGLNKGANDRPGMLGLIRREGSRLTILYYATGPENRPKVFENPPRGWWILKLERGG